MKKQIVYSIIGVSICIIFGGCSIKKLENIGEINEIKHITYENQILISPILHFTGAVFSGTQNIQIIRENSGEKKNYTLQYKPNQNIFSEEFRLDRGNIGYGENKYIFIFTNNDKVIATGELQISAYYQDIEIGEYTLYFNEKSVRNCGQNCWMSDSYETVKIEELSDSDVIGSGERYESKLFSTSDIMPYERSAILYRKGTIFMNTTGYVVYNKKLQQFFQAENIHSMEGNERVFLGDLYLNGKLIITKFPVKYSNTGGGSIIPIFYQPKRDIISTKWQDGDGCGYTKGEAIYSLSRSEMLRYSEISPQGITLQIANKKFEIIATWIDDTISLESHYSIIDTEQTTKKEDLLLNKEKVGQSDSESPCREIITRSIDDKQQKIIVKKLPIVGGKGQTFIRKFDNKGGIARIK